MMRLAVHGAAGRMGRRVVALAADDPAFRLVAAIEQPEHNCIGQDAGTLAGCSEVKVPVSSPWPDAIDVVIDFSLPGAVENVVEHSRQAGAALVMATTGLTDAHHQLLRSASEHIAIVWAPSMSLAVNLTMKLAQQTTRALKDIAGGLDIEIIERHHRFKEDAPSGTALKFGELIEDAYRSDSSPPAMQHIHGREGKTGARTRNEIGYHAIRTGDNPGEHTIVFGMLGETIELKVAASNRDCYAAGALAAAKWLDGKPPGLYSMFDVLDM